jgi:hypothetical protein
MVVIMFIVWTPDGPAVKQEGRTLHLPGAAPLFIDPDENTLGSGSEAAAFYAQLGRAVAHWGEIEDYILELFTFAMDADRYKCVIIFSKLGTIGPILETLNEILVISLTKEWYDKWHEVHIELKSLVSFRNNLAHNPVGKRLWASTSGQSGFQYFSHLGARKSYKADNWTASVDDIRAYNKKLLAVRDTIRSFGIPASARKTPTMPTPPRFPLSLAPAGAVEPKAEKPPKKAKKTGKPKD